MLKLNKSQKVLLWIIGWTSIGLIQATRQYFTFNSNEDLVPWMQLVIWELGDYYLWGLVSIFYYRISSVFSLEKNTLFKTITINIISMPLVISALLVIYSMHWYVTRSVFEHKAGMSLENLSEVIQSTLEYRFYISTIICLAIIFVCYAIRYYQRYRTEEERLSILQSRFTQAQLNLLKSQLHPHFLFNTLNSITALIHTDSQKADKMTTLLSDLLRFSFENAENQEILLMTELEFIDKYLQIQQIRFQDRMRVIKKIDPETLKAYIPNLLLQPLVENAVSHGLSKLSENGKLIIDIQKNSNNLKIKISDNGPGAEESLTQSNGLGLRNTKDRLEQLYRDNYHFTFGNTVDCGFEVKIEIPLLYEPKLKSFKDTQHD